jgi:hypothetical protein
VWVPPAECWDLQGRASEVETDLSETFRFIENEVQAYQEETVQKKKKKSFPEQVQKKRSIYHLAPVAVA